MVQPHDVGDGHLPLDCAGGLRPEQLRVCLAQKAMVWSALRLADGCRRLVEIMNFYRKHRRRLFTLP
ncbi:hypothetical protein COO91_07726 [Nostoc flagelliforme CCNUN1]|uniref:Uncharacterized protein n=1 Tax=Nostoc flagelliforme CCNUN1 TaxID=2038116 RepID=A0A2K8T1U8_9NOSO|nr:hypothetical protein [Nostoc flagelliforme]AUB41672.1 hypothetical protein COO91_07726 [Nostoc flagelliforme CCNUN1]